MHYHVLYKCASYYTRNFFHVELSGSYFNLLRGEFVFRYRTHHYLTSQIHRLSFVPLSTFSTLILFWRIRGKSLIQGQLIFWMTLNYLYNFTCSWHAIFTWIFSTWCRTGICKYFIDRVEHNNCIYRVLYKLCIFQLIKIISLSIWLHKAPWPQKWEFLEKKFQSVYTALKTSHKVTCN